MVLENFLAMDYTYHGNVRLDFFYDSPTPTGALLAYVVVVAWHFFGKGQDAQRPWVHLLLLYACFAASLYLLFLTYSRGAIIAVVAALGVHVIVQRRNLLASSAALIVTFAVVLLFVPDSTGRVASAVDISVDHAISNRLHLWRESFYLLKEHWKWGVGADAFRSEIYAWHQDVNRAERYITAVNTPITVLAYWGAPRGILLMLALGFSAAWTCLWATAGRSSHAVLSLALMVGFYGSAFFSTHKEPLLLAIDTLIFLSPIALWLSSAKRKLGPLKRPLWGLASIGTLGHLAAVLILLAIFPAPVGKAVLHDGDDATIFKITSTERSSAQSSGQPTEFVFASVQEREIACRIARAFAMRGQTALLYLAKRERPQSTLDESTVLHPISQALAGAGSGSRLTIFSSSAWFSLSTFTEDRNHDYPITSITLIGCPSDLELAKRLGACSAKQKALFVEEHFDATTLNRLTAACFSALVRSNYLPVFKNESEIPKHLVAVTRSQ